MSDKELRVSPRTHEESFPLQERVYDYLRELIISGALKPGQRILEAQIVEALDVGRSPARIALRQLLDEGFVYRHELRGYVVGGLGARAAEDEFVELQPMPFGTKALWEPIYAEIERELFTRILFRPVRVTEDRLADHFDVSRTVARDVLARLHTNGLISKNKSGHWVADQISPTKASDLYELRSLLEPAALESASRAVSRRVLKRMMKSLERWGGNVPRLDGPKVEALEHELHVELLSYCSNAELLRALTHTRLVLSANRYLQDVYHSTTETETSGVIDQHKSVLECLLDGRASAAAEAMRSHLRRANEIWKERYLAISALDTSRSPLPDYFLDVKG